MTSMVIEDERERCDITGADVESVGEVSVLTQIEVSV